MKISEKTYSLLWIFGAFVVYGIIYLINMRLKKEDALSIEQNISYAIGVYNSTITSYNRGGSTNKFFDYKANNTSYLRIINKGSNYYKVDAKRGDKFLVIYDKKKPELCQMLFDYPIRDSADFKQYLDQFKEYPLDVKLYFVK